MKALVFERNIPRVAAARVASALGSGLGAAVGPLRLVDVEPPDLPGPEWARLAPSLSGICGSDLATLDGRASRYFEDLVSFPFVPGHEVVGVIESVPTAAQDGPATDQDQGGRAGGPRAGAAASIGLEPGDRVVLEPVLSCRARGIDPMCAACQQGRTGDCERVAFGHLAPGLQTGYCADTGGGWSAAGLVAHSSQVHRVPESLDERDAVMVEPTACATHAVLRAGLDDGDTVAVLGAGTLGLAVTAALATLAATGRIATPGALIVGARYPHQRRWAVELGATVALPPDQLGRAVRRRSRSLAIGPPTTASRRLTGGADAVFDCVGSADSIAESLALVRPRGKVVLVGMPGKVHVDLASLWHREVTLAGAYAYGRESLGPGPVRTFDLAFEVVGAHRLGRLVSATYPIERFEEAVAHAGAAGRRGAVKVAFELGALPPRGRRAAPISQPMEGGPR